MIARYMTLSSYFLLDCILWVHSETEGRSGKTCFHETKLRQRLTSFDGVGTGSQRIVKSMQGGCDPMLCAGECCFLEGFNSYMEHALLSMKKEKRNTKNSKLVLVQLEFAPRTLQFVVRIPTKDKNCYNSWEHNVKYGLSRVVWTWIRINTIHKELRGLDQIIRNNRRNTLSRKSI